MDEVIKRFKKMGLFFVGCLSMGFGLFMLGWVRTTIEILLGQLIAGFGFGLIYLIPQTLVVEHTQIGIQRDQGMSNLFAGIYSGLICSSSIGGILADRIAQEYVFFSGSVP